jgi:hypothetical protein
MTSYAMLVFADEGEESTHLAVVLSISSLKIVAECSLIDPSENDCDVSLRKREGLGARGRYLNLAS